MAKEAASDLFEEASPTSNLERLLAHLEHGTLAWELVHSWLQADPAEEAMASLKEVIDERLARARDDRGGNTG
jgi:hypothetical protein